MSLIDEALRLGEQGYHVLPLLVRSDGSKQPLSKWSTEATTDAEKIQGLNWEDATHVAVACEPSGIVVIDIDTYFDEETETLVEGEDLLHEWLNLASGHSEQAMDLLDPPWALTQGNGIHIFLRADPNRPMTNSVKDLTPCIDVRGVGGIVGVYVEALPHPDTLPQVPEWLYELALRESEHLTPQAPPRPPEFSEGEAGTDYGVKGLSGELKAVQDSWDRDEGTFNRDLNRSAYAVGQLVGGGQLDYEHAYQCLRLLLDDLGVPGNQYKSLDSGFASGYQRPREPRRVVITDESLTAMSEKWLSASELDGLPEPEWLLPGWLELDSVAQIYGAPKTGKSFIALDIAGKLSRGFGWPNPTNTPARPVRVAYIIAEGVRGFVLRKQAWEMVNGNLGEVRFYPEAIQVTGKEWPVAIEYLSQWRPSLVIVDTQARCMIGVDENTPAEINKAYPHIDELRRQTGACVLLVHHTNKEGSSARGSNAILANINTEIRVSKSFGRIRVRNSAQKNDVEANEVYFKLNEVGPSVVPELSVQVPADMAENIKPNHSRLAIRQHLEAHPDVPQTTNEILEAVDVSKSVFYKTIKSMIEEGEVTRVSVYRNNRTQAAYSCTVSPEPEGS